MGLKKVIENTSTARHYYNYTNCQNFSYTNKRFFDLKLLAPSEDVFEPNLKPNCLLFISFKPFFKRVLSKI